MELSGVHHVSALTAHAERNVAFYTRTLGLRLTKKTVNQDDPSSYHLFYGDAVGSPGTELTFFDIPRLAPNRPGSGSISPVGLRVGERRALTFWQARLAELGVDQDPIADIGGRACLRLRDFEGQELLLVAEEGEAGDPGGTPWERSPVPAWARIRGLGPVMLTVRRSERTARVLTGVLGFRLVRSYACAAPGQPDVLVFATAAGGAAAEVHLAERGDLEREQLGRGGVHHVAFRVPTEEEHRAWLGRLEASGLQTSGLIDRYYFRSIYFREPSGILFELATDGPGFLVDEEEEHLGEGLALPPFLEPRRAAIEANLHPLDTPGR